MSPRPLSSLPLPPTAQLCTVETHTVQAGEVEQSVFVIDVAPECIKDF